MTAPRADLAFVYVRMSSFVRRDLELLQRRFSVLPVAWEGKRSLPALVRAVAATRGSVARFAGDHAFVAALAGAVLRKPHMVIVGGLDASWVPELGQGAFGNARDSLECGFVYRTAAGVFTVDEGLKRDIVRHTGLRGDNILTVPNGFDAAFWTPGGAKEELVLTVGDIDREVARRKGYATFVEAARRVPEARFVLLGDARDGTLAELQARAPANFAHVPAQPPEALRAWYRRAKVYCQLSRHEGMPNALGEAMLCECVPVGTEHYGIPTLMGDAGFHAPFADVDATAAAVRQALASPNGPRARERIARLFPLERRARELGMAVGAVLEGRRLGDVRLPAWVPGGA